MEVPMPGESWVIKEPKEMGFFNEVYEVALRSGGNRNERVVIR